MPSSPLWPLAVAELTYFAAWIFPLVYVLYTHRWTGRTGWLGLLLYLALQCAGSGVIVAAGPDHFPPAVALVVMRIGLGPLMLALTSLVHEYVRIAGWVQERRQSKRAWASRVAFQFAILVSLPTYVCGLIDSYTGTPSIVWQTWYKLILIVLLLVHLILCVAFAMISRHSKGGRAARPLFWSIGGSLFLLGIRIMYSTVAAFNQSDPSLNPLTERVVCHALLTFLPEALIVAATIVAGITTAHADVLSPGATEMAAVFGLSPKGESGSPGA